MSPGGFERGENPAHGRHATQPDRWTGGREHTSGDP